MTSRERRWTRFRWLDLGLSLAVGAGIALLSKALHLSDDQTLALALLGAVPLYLWLGWRQYFVLDELSQRQMLIAYSVHGFVTVAAVLLLAAWSLWTASALPPGSLLLACGLGWASSWISWWWQRRPVAHGA